MKYLSSEWIQAADDILNQTKPICDAAIKVQVSKKTEANIKYYVTLGPEKVNFTFTEPNNVKLEYSTDWDTATAIAKGELSSQKAFLEESLTITGEVNLLDKYSKQIAEINDSLGQLRDNTIWV